MARKPVISLLIAAYNEERVIENTILSAVNAGLKPEHIYVVDDCSADKTFAIAKKLLGNKNVMRVSRSGKGLAISKAAKKFELSSKYQWIHLADADCYFAPRYFNIFRRELRTKNAAATGYVKSMKGSIIGQYRVMEYTVGMEIVRRFQAITGLVAIIPGPTSCFRADVFEKLNFRNKALAEDFDVTLQIHRKDLGRIQFIEEAEVYTQDPDSLSNYITQIKRWYKGILQGMLMHRIGLKANKIDAYLIYQVMLNLVMFINYFIVLPFTAFRHDPFAAYSVAFLVDFGLISLVVFVAALRAKRLDILNALPHIYALRWISLAVFVQSFIEVVILGKDRKPKNGTWEVIARQTPIKNG